MSAYWLGLTVGRFMLRCFLRSLGSVRTISLSLVLTLLLAVLMAGLHYWLVQQTSLPSAGSAG
ncbi:hypothetical protein [Pseudanabaena sp. FACHB-2040]|uniref:hypothetical protein n=1 Tax=Pseudanabaena sp. FACHB-2040 TaxID=2692859 RepID=UPI0016827679|nr:hypothetical protein [Pseudanabaena sp. FACHB-2040]MBD2258270.1 hypothetical protein [Pseudanabaena sp. FACHB-2040]